MTRRRLCFPALGLLMLATVLAHGQHSAPINVNVPDIATDTALLKPTGRSLAAFTPIVIVPGDKSVSWLPPSVPPLSCTWNVKLV